jgi:hypothetical protein
MDKNNHLTINVRKDQVMLVQEFEQRCSSKKLSTAYVITELIKQYLHEDIYVGSEEDPDVIAQHFIGRFKKFLPGWPIPTITNDLVVRINRAALRQSPEWWENLFHEVAEIPWTSDWQPNFLWLLISENCFKITSGQFNRLKGRQDHEKHAEERRKVREEEKLEKDRVKKEEAERKSKEKAELARAKQEKIEQLVKEKEEKELKKQEKIKQLAKEKNEEKTCEEESSGLEQQRDWAADFERYGGND